MSRLIGHEEQERAFLESFASGRLHHAWLLTGPKGVGKASFAHKAGLFLLSREGGPDMGVDDGPSLFGDDIPAAPVYDFAAGEGTQAQHLMDAGTHPEFHLLERETKDKSDDLARNITVAQVRELIHSLTGTPSIAHYRVCIVDAIDDLERGAANALLKTLEEPPRDTIFFLVSHAPGRLLPTIRSRCRILRFNALDDGAMDRWLQLEKPQLLEQDRAALIKASGGSPGRALDVADLALGELRERLEKIAHTGDRDNSQRHDLARTLNLKAARPRYEAMLELAPQIASEHAKRVEGNARAHAIDTWEKLRDLTQFAVQGSYDPAMTSFEVGTLLAGLAHPPR